MYIYMKMNNFLKRKERKEKKRKEITIYKAPVKTPYIGGKC